MNNMASKLASNLGQQRRKLRVLVDMDGVLCEFDQHFLDTFKKLHPGQPFVPIEERHHFYLSKDYRKYYQEKAKDMCISIIDSEGFYGNLAPIPGGVEALKEMASMEGVEVFLCSSPQITSQYSAQEKLNWIREYMGAEWMERLVLSTDKTIVKGDILIDDKDTITGAEDPPTWDHILFTSCHNRHRDLSELRAVRRLDSWTDGQWKEIVEEYRQKLMNT